VYDRTGSSRGEDGRLVIGFIDGHIINCNVEFSGQNPVRFIER
jgi:hypothetical protein